MRVGRFVGDGSGVAAEIWSITHLEAQPTNEDRSKSKSAMSPSDLVVGDRHLTNTREKNDDERGSSAPNIDMSLSY